MSKINDGGQAFPCDGPMRVPEDQLGMTKREVFAAFALAGILANGRKGGPKVCDKAALDAYDFADAMLAAREGGGA